MWEALTGLSGRGPGTRTYMLPSSRGGLVFVGAAPREPAHLGAWSFLPREVVFLAEGPPGAALEDWPYRIDAVVGPATLSPDGVLALDVAHRKIGLVRERKE